MPCYSSGHVIAVGLSPDGRFGGAAATGSATTTTITTTTTTNSSAAAAATTNTTTADTTATATANPAAAAGAAAAAAAAAARVYRVALPSGAMGPQEDRQEAPHPHMALPDGDGGVLITDLGQVSARAVCEW